MIEKLDGMSKDIVKENVEKLKELFPSIVKEGKIDFEELELLLGENINRASEQYSFTWNGKTEATKLAQKRSTGTLRPCKEVSVGRNGEKRVWDNETQNLYIEGDNLEVLKLLQTSYNGKIKMIYIDPPYNTGHDFVYKDNFEDNLKNYKEITGQAQKSNAESDGRYHTNWLNMMYPRLKLARNLLTDDGVIFISIDDNEQSNLKKICDEIFGENNFVGCLSRIIKKGSSMGKFFSPSIDYIFAYTKNINHNEGFAFPQTDEYLKAFNQQDEKGLFKTAGLYQSSLDPLRGCVNQRYFIECPDGTFVIPPGDVYPTISKDGEKVVPLSKNDKVWRWSVETYLKEKHNLIFTKVKNSSLVDASGKQSVWTVLTKQYLKSEEESKVVPGTLIESFTNQNGSSELKELNIEFSFPKPSKLIGWLMRVCKVKNSDITLDFFSGSATTAHAVMQLNAEDGGNRRFIMVQLPEILEDKTDVTTFKNICEIGKERIRRAGKKIKEELYATCSKGYAVEDMLNEKEKQELEELTTRASNLDIGFKVLKLDTSNLVKWNNEPTSDIEEVERRIQESMDYLQEGRSALDLVYEIILKYGLDPTAPVTETANQKAHIIDGGDYKFLISSEPNLTLEDIETFANEPVGTYLFADRCFSDDNLLINAEEILKSKNKEMRVF